MSRLTIQDIPNPEYTFPDNPLVPVLLEQNRKIAELTGHLDRAREIIAKQDIKLGRLRDAVAEAKQRRGVA